MLLLNLQTFAEETSSEGVGIATDTGADISSVDVSATETQEIEQTTPENVEVKPTFDELIKGDYKKDYDKAVRKAINKRFKNQQDLQGQIDRLNPLLDVVGTRYGVTPTEQGYDVEALIAKIEDDNALYEQEAFEKGIDVETLKQQKKLERQNRALNQRLQSIEADRQRQEAFNKVLQQAEETKATYPDFDLDAEMLNADFGRLIARDIPVKTAYEVIHKDEILTQGMQYAVQHTKENIVRDIQSGQRPIENGMSSQSGTSVGGKDVSKLTLKDFEDIKRRAANGEKIMF